MENLDTTIKKLQLVISDPNCKNMNLSNIKGYLGELLVAQKLMDEGFQIKMTGNQSGHDIEIPNRKVAIDVKFSTIKTEVKDCPSYWGWVLKHENKKRPISCTHFVCVAVDENLDPFKYLLIKSSDIEEFSEYGIAQFKNVEKGCMILKDNSKLEGIANTIIRETFRLNQLLLKMGIIKEVTNFKNAFLAP